MKISIKNFKAIGFISDYEIKPLTILSGTNSCGKSSFIQLLLLLKQTLEIDSTKFPLYIDGDYYSVKNYKDIIRGKSVDNKLEIGFALKKSDFEKFGERIEKSIFDNLSDYECKLNLKYDFLGETLYIQEFLLTYTFNEKTTYVKFIQDKKEKYVVESDNEYFIKGIYDEVPPLLKRIFYSSIFPTSYEVIRTVISENPSDGNTMEDTKKVNEYPNLKSIKSYLDVFFKELSYVGPLRIEPKDSYPNSSHTETVGTKGENIAELLEKRQRENIELYFPIFENDLLKFEKKTCSLIDATNYWICDIFKFGKKIFVRDIAESCSIILVNYNNIETTIKHVGFGISQILPIIVQGLLLNRGGILILEQPEIHLHPKIQSLLFDFTYSLILQDKNVIIETHSDHFITRMRRRIAEDETSELKDKIKLTFIEPIKNNLSFNSLNLDEFGTLNYFPVDFIERPDIELKAIIKAQMNKRIKKTL